MRAKQVDKGRSRSVPAVFQIWVRCTARRARLPEITTHTDFAFTSPEHADFTMWRVGANAGRVGREFERTDDTHYFIKGNVEHIMRKLQPAFAAVAQNTAGQRSLAKSEIVAIYSQYVSGNPKSIAAP